LRERTNDRTVAWFRSKERRKIKCRSLLAGDKAIRNPLLARERAPTMRGGRFVSAPRNDDSGRLRTTASAEEKDNEERGREVAGDFISFSGLAELGPPGFGLRFGGTRSPEPTPLGVLRLSGCFV
jgi:hypothetical protein